MNINGLNNPVKQSRLYTFLKTLPKLSVVVLTDTRLAEGLSQFLSVLKPLHFLTCARDSHPGGIVFLSYHADITFSSPLQSDDGRLLSASIVFNNITFQLSGIYVPAPPTSRSAFWNFSFRPFLDSLPSTSHHLLCGDFNFTESPLDRTSSRPLFERRDADHFHTLTDQIVLHDSFRLVSPNLRDYTKKSHANTFSRLDRFYNSSSLSDCLSDYTHIAIPPFLSDHISAPLLSLHIGSSSPLGAGLWRMNTSNIGKPGLQRALLPILSGRHTSLEWDGLKLCVSKHAKHHAVVEKQRREGTIKHLLQLTTRLHQELIDAPLSLTLQQRQASAHSSLQKYLDNKFTFLRIKSHSNFSAHGERPSPFLSSFIHTKKNATQIKSLTLPDGSSTSSQSEIAGHASAFYTALFSIVKPGNPFHALWQTPQSVLPPSALSSLSSRFTKDELLLALKSLPSNKTPGLDGLPKEFYVHFWDSLADSLLDFANATLYGGDIPPSLLRAVTVLIFKKGDPALIENYRPISLLGTDYKIIAKALAMRLSPLLSSLVHTDQSGFVPGRDIRNTVLDILDTFDHCNLTSKEGLLLLVDFRKAYDTLDRNYLYSSLSHLGLPPSFIASVRSLHEGSSTSLLLNGSLGSPIPLCSGVRQGCPLAPSLFILALEPFHRYLKTRLPGISLSNTVSKLNASFADDLTIMLNNYQELPIANDALRQFESLSGEAPNWNKMALIPMGPTALQIPPPQDPLSTIPILTTSTYERVLGINLSADPNDFTFTWDPLLSVLKRRVSLFKAAHLPTESRVHIVNSYLAPSFLYQAFFHPPPPAMWKSILHLLFNFASDNKVSDSSHSLHLWKKDNLTAPSALGGLGLVHPDLRLQALGVTQVLRAFNPDPLALNTITRAAVSLPLDLHTFLAAPGIVRFISQTSLRWRLAIEHFFKLPLVVSPCPLWPEALLQEPLAFHREVARPDGKPFGLLKRERFLLACKVTVRDIVKLLPHSRSFTFTSLCEWSSRFPPTSFPGSTAIFKLICSCIPCSWVVALKGIQRQSFIQNNVWCFNSEAPNLQFVFKFLRTSPCPGSAYFDVFSIDPLSREVSDSPCGPRSLLLFSEMFPALVNGSKVFGSITDPSVLGLRLSLFAKGSPPPHSHILKLLSSPHVAPYRLRFETRFGKRVKWIKLEQAFHHSSIPPIERDVGRRILVGSIQVGSRLHWCPSIDPSCPNCPGPSPFETREHAFFNCPSVHPVISGLQHALRASCNLSLPSFLDLLVPTERSGSDDFPSLLMILCTFRAIWKSRCDSRFERSRFSPLSTTHQALRFLLLAFQSYFSPFNVPLSRHKVRRHNRHNRFCVDHHILVFSPSSPPVFHPDFLRPWFTHVPFQPH
jgi:exonuclease III